jgi:hypothetical protein
MHSGKHEEARELYRKLWEKYPNDAHLSHAAIYVSGDFDWSHLWKTNPSKSPQSRQLQAK